MARLVGHKEELAAAYGAGEISLAEWKVARTPIEERLAELDRPSSPPMSAVEDMTGEDAAARWSTLPPERRHAIIRTYVETVIVHPATRQGNVFDSSRVQVVPRPA